MESSTTLSGHDYSYGRLDSFKQFHIARRIAPILAAMAEAATSLPEDFFKKDDKDKVEGLVLSRMARPIAEALRSMSDEDCEYVIRTCLAACYRKEGAGWQKVMVPNSGIVFEDINLGDMMNLTIGTIMHNMGNFFPVPGSSDNSASSSRG